MHFVAYNNICFLKIYGKGIAVTLEMYFNRKTLLKFSRKKDSRLEEEPYSVFQGRKTVLYNSNRIERRVGKRLELSLPMTLPGQKVKSKNIGPSGVYFEVITNDIEKYSPGKTSTIEIIVSTSTPMLPKRTVKLTGTGMIIRVDEIEIINQDRKLGVALKFIKKLEPKLSDL